MSISQLSYIKINIYHLTAMASPIPLAVGASIPMFKPTDEEILVHYLHRRAVDQPLPSMFITDCDILNHTPWDLVPDGTSEKYFFYCRVKRFACGIYWKRTGKDGFWRPSGSREVPIFCNRSWSRGPLKVGSKKTFVFHHGKPPAGQRTDWVMQEYSLDGVGLSPYRLARPCKNNNLGKSSNCTEDLLGKKDDDPADNTSILAIPDESWVVCRIQKKGPRNKSVITGNNIVDSAGEDNIPFFDFLGLGKEEEKATGSTSPVGNNIDGPGKDNILFFRFPWAG